MGACPRHGYKIKHPHSLNIFTSVQSAGYSLNFVPQHINRQQNEHFRKKIKIFWAFSPEMKPFYGYAPDVVALKCT